MAKVYPFGASQLSFTRLNLQHYAIKEALGGHLLDPTIDFRKPGLRIADLCCGTGIWMLEMAQHVHETSTMEGLDVNLAQHPPEEWLPPNVVFRKFNVFDELGAEMVKRYDIMHLRLTLCFLKEEHVQDVLTKVMRMLKPGGYVQWVEFDHAHDQFFSRQEGYEPAEFPKVFRTGWNMIGFRPPSWIANLEFLFQEAGLQAAKAVTMAIKKWMMPMQNDNVLIAIEEMCQLMEKMHGGDKKMVGKIEGVRAQLRKAEEEIRERGVGVWTPVVCAVGRKPQ